MPEPTVKEDEVDIKKDEPLNQTDTSEESKIWTDEYPKWQKMLPKEYWGNEKLANYDSLKSVIEEAINPKVKAPEQYNLGLDESTSKELETVLRKADIDEDNAKEIAKIISDKSYKPFKEDDLKDVYGLADYEVENAYVDKAIAKILPEKLREEMKNSDIKFNKYFFELARVVGRNLSDADNLDFKQEIVLKKRSNDPFMDLLLSRN